VETKTLVTVLVVAAIVWFLFLRRPTVPGQTGYVPPRPPPQQSTAGSVAAAVAPALGSFLSSIAKGFGGSSGTSSSSSDDLMTPSFSGDSGSAFSDDSLSFD